MKTSLTIIMLILLFGMGCAVEQQPKAWNDKPYTRTDTGFIYYWSPEGYAPYISLVRNPKPVMTYKDFTTKNIRYAYAKSYDGLGLDLVDMVKQYGGEYKLVQYDSLTLKLIPVSFTYTVNTYHRNKKEFNKDYRVLQKFKLSDKWVKIRAYGGISINIKSLTPIKGYH